MHRIAGRMALLLRLRMLGATLGCMLQLVACGHGSTTAVDDANPQSANGASLPKPAAVAGSVTGMPDRPGPGNVGLPPADASAPDVAKPIDGAASDDATTPDGASAINGQPSPVAPPASDQPAASDAAAVIRDYYASIDSGNYPHAWSLWSDSGRSSGQTLQQFADGFANTAHVSVHVGEPGAIDAAAGSRFIQVPVSIDATARDGNVRHYSGTYVLRRSEVDGATTEERAWRIASATMRAQAQ